jgi:outer membrane lipoprotein-sorting protein
LKTISLFFLLSAVLCLQSFAQQDAQLILKNVRDNFLKVKDYTADADIKVDVDFVKIPVKHAKVYYKQPDKFRFKADGFALLPKRGANLFTLNLSNEMVSAIYIKEENINGVLTDVVKVIPLESNGDIILSTLWVSRDFKIYKLESTTKTQGTFLASFQYNKFPFNLPAQVEITFDIQKAEIPVGLTLDMESLSKKKESKNTTGRVVVKYSNYQVNTGLQDSVFK